MDVDLDGTVREYWKQRLSQHFSNRYRGRGLRKFPEDLATYRDIIWETKPDTIIELGTCDGGSALWFADQLVSMLGAGRVVTIDQQESDVGGDHITFLRGDLRDVELPALSGRVMVVDDSAHTFDITLAALRRYAPLVTKGCYFVVEDTIVDTELSIWPNVDGAGEAVTAYLAEDPRFERRDRATFGLTMHMGGWLEAVA